MTRLRAFALGECLAIVVLSACSTAIGQPFDPNLVNQLRPGVSTRADATRLFGTPDFVKTNSAGETDVEWGPWGAGRH
jgi:hypothetical protein